MSEVLLRHKTSLLVIKILCLKSMLKNDRLLVLRKVKSKQLVVTQFDKKCSGAVIVLLMATET